MNTQAVHTYSIGDEVFVWFYDGIYRVAITSCHPKGYSGTLNDGSTRQFTERRVCRDSGSPPTNPNAPW